MLPTPFAEDGSLLLDDLPRLVAYVLTFEPDGIAAVGLAGEVRTLNHDERLELAAAVVRVVDGRVPVLIGTSADTTAEAVALAQHAAGLGAAVLMVSPPAIPGMDDDELYRHYAAVAAAVPDTEIMLQDAPHEVGVRLTAALIARLCAIAPNIRSAKMEGAPAGQSIIDVKAGLAGDRLGFVGGNGGLYFMDILDAGIVGMIPSCEALRLVNDIFRLYGAGKRDAALARYRELLPLLVFENQNGATFVASNKEILHRLGVLSSARTRSGPALSEWSRATLFRHAAPLNLPHQPIVPES